MAPLTRGFNQDGSDIFALVSAHGLENLAVDKNKVGNDIEVVIQQESSCPAP